MHSSSRTADRLETARSMFTNNRACINIHSTAGSSVALEIDSGRIAKS